MRAKSATKNVVGMKTTQSLFSVARQHSVRRSTSPPRASLKKAGRLTKRLMPPRTSRIHVVAVLKAGERRPDRPQFQSERFDKRPVGLRRAKRDVIARLKQRAAEHAKGLRVAARAEGEDRDAGRQFCLSMTQVPAESQ